MFPTWVAVVVGVVMLATIVYLVASEWLSRRRANDDEAP
jgi:hypothetical protein